MTTLFRQVGPSYAIAYADDSSNFDITLTGAEAASVNALYVFNPDTANVVAVTASSDQYESAAVIPVDGTPGLGTVIGPGQSVTLRVNQPAQGNLYIGVAGASATGVVYVSLGQA